jgi:hypothetical protein
VAFRVEKTKTRGQHVSFRTKIKQSPAYMWTMNLPSPETMVGGDGCFLF